MILFLHPMPIPVFGNNSVEVYVWICIFVAFWIFMHFSGKKKSAKNKELQQERHDKVVRLLLEIDEKVDKELDKTT